MEEQDERLDEMEADEEHQALQDEMEAELDPRHEEPDFRPDEGTEEPPHVPELTLTANATLKSFKVDEKGVSLALENLYFSPGQIRELSKLVKRPVIIAITEPAKIEPVTEEKKDDPQGDLFGEDNGPDAEVVDPPAEDVPPEETSETDTESGE